MLEQRTAFAELLSSKEQDVLEEMLSLVYDAAIKAQFDQHIGAEPREWSDGRGDVRNGSRTRGFNTRAGSLDLEIPRARNTNCRPTVIEQFRRTKRELVSVIQEAFVTGFSTRKKMKYVLEQMESGGSQNRR